KKWDAQHHLNAAFLGPAIEIRRLFAEMWGTFISVVFSAGVPMMVATHHQVTYAMALAARGMVVTCIIYFMGAVSGAHLNPVVTLGFALRRNFPWGRVPGYLISQFFGAWLAVLFLRSMLGPVSHLGASMPGEGTNGLQAFVMEIFLTAVLINIILGTASGAFN